MKIARGRRQSLAADVKAQQQLRELKPTPKRLGKQLVDFDVAKWLGSFCLFEVPPAEVESRKRFERAASQSGDQKAYTTARRGIEVFFYRSTLYRHRMVNILTYLRLDDGRLVLLCHGDCNDRRVWRYYTRK